MRDLELQAVLPGSDSTYEKYFRGTRNSKELRDFIVKYFDESEFCKGLVKMLRGSGTAIAGIDFVADLSY
ncbi:hypothetical protein [Acetatifactor aquisgranensis]|uniref:hypothetical protein n=1 Tax=Acetatifactor aquisgranensis TaxID=2941233 RepID=UPI00203C7690|nr:hypothetical protein [Acetatifactor aquisgranensis]